MAAAPATFVVVALVAAVALCGGVSRAQDMDCWAALGYGLDGIDANLTGGGPAPIGGQTAALTPFVRDVATQFCYQEVGHLKYVSNQLTSQFDQLN
jgi:hypothetical protein